MHSCYRIDVKVKAYRILFPSILKKYKYKYMEVTNTTHTKRNKKDTNAKRAFKHIIGGIATSNYLSVDKDAKTNIKRNRYKYKYNKKKQKCKEDMEAHYYWWEPAASFSLSLNPPNNLQEPSTQYALSLSLMMATYHDDDVVENTRIQT